jgi:hypothetical protein
LPVRYAVYNSHVAREAEGGKLGEE